MILAREQRVEALAGARFSDILEAAAGDCADFFPDDLARRASAGETVRVARGVWRRSPAQSFHSPATRRYIGRAPKSVTSTSTSVATGARAPAASAAIPG